MKPATILPVIAILVFAHCSSGLSSTQTSLTIEHNYTKPSFSVDSIPPIAPDIPSHLAWIYNPTNHTIKLCKYISDEEFFVWEDIYPGNNTISLVDCGRNGRKACPYILYVYTGNKATDKINAEPKGRFRVFHHPRRGFQIEPYKR